MNAYDTNPFNPQFGRRPKQFIGRELIINDFLQSLSNLDDPHRTTIITGIRGTGKTAILSDVHRSLDPGKYAVVDVTAQDGMLLEVLDELLRGNKKQNWLGKAFAGVQGFSASAFGFSLGVTKRNGEESHSFRYMLTGLLDDLRAKSIKTVFLIDEAHSSAKDLREFAVVYQHLVREEFDVALLMAGLPSSVNDILNDEVLTFLRRAWRVELQSIDPKAVEIAYQQAFNQAGRSFSGAALQTAAEATDGYPYLIQLLGYFIYQEGSEKIDDQLVARALQLSKLELFKNVHDMLFQRLSARDRDFLFAMTPDDAQSDFGVIRERLGVSPGYASKYRERLLVAGLVKATGHGKLAFAPPYMREYLITKM